MCVYVNIHIYIYTNVRMCVKQVWELRVNLLLLSQDEGNEHKIVSTITRDDIACDDIAFDFSMLV